MKNSAFLVVVAFLFFGLSGIWAQNFNHASELSNMVSVPNSPEAQAFASYGNTSVSLHTGQPNIGVPIYTHSGRELNLPISLTFDASGFKQNQMATNVGLGWNLAAGGRVSRIVNGQPDEYELLQGDSYKSYRDTGTKNKIVSYTNQQGSQFQTKDALINYLTFLHEVNDGKYDTQPDYFRVNAFGLSETLVYAINNGAPTIKALNNPRLNIVVSTTGSGMNTEITGWRITADNGTEYHFELAERTWTHQDPEQEDGTFTYAWEKEYNSSWVLTKVVSPMHKDVYEFTYIDQGYWTSPVFADLGQSHSLNLSGGTGSTATANPHTLGVYVAHKIKQQFLNEVYHNDKRILSIEEGIRYDISNNAKKVERIRIHKTNPVGSDIYLSTIDFTYDYFKESDVINPTTEPNKLKMRLRLLGITMSNGNEQPQHYAFEYSGNYLPEIGNGGMDYLGYPRSFTYGQEGIYYPNYSENGFSLPGANRNATPEYSIDKLTRMYYPTGGYTDFEYEQNTIRVSTGTTTTSNYEYFTDFSLTATAQNLDNYDEMACNTVGATTTTTTPATAGQSFQVSASQAGTFRLSYDKAAGGGGTPTGFFDANKSAYILRKPDPETSYSYTDLFDQNCNLLLEDELIWQYDDNFGTSHTENISIDEGDYQILLVNIDQGSTVSLELEEQITTTTTNYTYEGKAGIRVNSITDYSDLDVRVRKRTFDYPSGKEIFKPNLVKFSTQQVVNPENGDIADHPFIHRYASVNWGDKPHVVYPTVVESVVDDNDEASNGTVSHRFNVTNANDYRTGIYYNKISGVQSSVRNYTVDFRLGKKSRTTVRTVDTEETPSYSIQSSSSEYDHQQFVELKGIGIATNLNNANRYVTLVQNNSGTWSVQLVPGTWTDANTDGGDFGGNWEAPECTEINNPALCEFLRNPILGALYFQKSFTRGNWGMIKQSTSTAYDEDKTLTQVTDFYYYGEDEGFTSGRTITRTPVPIEDLPNDDPSGDETSEALVLGLLKNRLTTDSSGETIRMHYSYPGNFNTDYTSLITSNMLSGPVRTRAYRQGTMMQEQQTEYNGIYPEKIYVQKGSSNPKEERLEFSRYSDGLAKNLIEARKQDDRPIAYIWSYDQRYLVAQVENTTFNEVATALGISEAALMDFDEASLNSLNVLRTALPQSLVTTYTYIPQVGVKTMTDPRGYSASYEYDDLHRLVKVIDDQGKVLETYDYNTRPFETYTQD